MTLKDLVDITLLRLHQFLLVLECCPFEGASSEEYTQEMPLYSQSCGNRAIVDGRDAIKVFVGIGM